MPGILAWPLAGLAGVTLPGWVGALVVLLLVLAISFLLRKPLVFILTRIPVIGGGLANIIGQAVDTVQGWAFGWLGPIAYSIATVILAPAQLGVAAMSAMVGGFEYALGNTRRLITATYGSGGILAVQRSLSAGVAAIRNTDIPTAADRARRLAVAAAAALVAGEAADRLAGDRTTAAAALNQVRAEAAERARQVTAARDQAAALVSAEARIRLAGDELLDRQAKQEAATRAAAEAALSGRVGTLERERIPALERELEGVRDVTIPQVQAKEAADVAVLTGELTIAQEALRCLDPLCSSGYSGLVGQLLVGAELLAILELVGAAVRDPQGTAQGTAGQSGALHDLGAGLLAPFIGQA